MTSKLHRAFMELGMILDPDTHAGTTITMLVPPRDMVTPVVRRTVFIAADGKSIEYIPHGLYSVISAPLDSTIAFSQHDRNILSQLIPTIIKRNE